MFLPQAAQRCRSVNDAGLSIVHDQPLPGFIRFYVFDPFGNRIELLSPV